MGPRAGMDDSEEITKFCAYQNSKPDRPARSVDTILTTISGRQYSAPSIILWQFPSMSFPMDLSHWPPRHLTVPHRLSVNFTYLFTWLLCQVGARCWWCSWLRQCATSQKVAGSIPDGVIGIFSMAQSFRPHYGPAVDSASNRNEYHEYFLGVKAAGAYS